MASDRSARERFVEAMTSLAAYLNGIGVAEIEAACDAFADTKCDQWRMGFNDGLDHMNAGEGYKNTDERHDNHDQLCRASLRREVFGEKEGK